MRTATILLAGLLLAPELAGCSGSNAAAERQMDEARKEIMRMQANNERLNERVTVLEAAQASRTTNARRESPVSDRPKLKVVKLLPGQETDEPNGEVADTDRAAADDDDAAGAGLEGGTVIRLEGSRSAVKTKVSTSSEKAADRAKEAKRSAQTAKDYESAIALVKNKQYDKALEKFAEFLVRYPDDTNADNAVYWRGECFFAKGEYARAAQEFSGLLARFPLGNKVPDALLKLGMCQLKSGDRAKATETFAQLRKEHPGSDAAHKIPKE